MQPVATYPAAWPGFTLAAPTGAVELRVSEAAHGTALRPARVTDVLTAFLATVDGVAVDAGLIWSLSVGTRERLLQQVAATCRAQPDWFDCPCPDCGAIGDIAFDLAQMPVAEVPAGFPQMVLETPQGPMTFRVPNGSDEVALLAVTSGLQRVLLQRCCLADAVDWDAMDDAQIAGLEAALDHHTPDCADIVTTDCPACGAAIAARVDPLAYAFPGEAGVLTDVHLLGRSYQWREADILALPSARRQAYVRMITAPQRGVGA